jgi:RNA polymerase sigma factor (TIGR02999 family)
MNEVTQILGAMGHGDAKAANELLPLVYEELRRLAACRMADEAAGHTLQPTALVHEAWLRLAGNDPSVPFANRAHFFAAAAEAMRRILIERARRKGAGKRGGDWQRIDLNKVEIAADADDDTLLLVDEALEKLAQEDANAAEVAKLRFFGGLTLEEAGHALGVTDRTAKRYWAYARAWLFDELRQALGH